MINGTLNPQMNCLVSSILPTSALCVCTDCLSTKDTPGGAPAHHQPPFSAKITRLLGTSQGHAGPQAPGWTAGQVIHCPVRWMKKNKHISIITLIMLLFTRSIEIQLETLYPCLKGVQRKPMKAKYKEITQLTKHLH